MIGIYKITSPTGKVYIGQSIDIKKRFSTYKNIKGSADQIRLNNSFLKHGIDNHRFEVITECDISDLNCLERYYQELYTATGRHGLNCSLTQSKNRSGKLSEITRLKMSNVRKGVPHSAARREKSKTINYDHLIRYGSDNGFSGKTHTEKTRKAISDANKSNKYCLGRFVSKETRLKISIGHTRKIINTETGEIFNSRAELAKELNMNPSTLRNKLNGSNKKSINYKYI